MERKHGGYNLDFVVGCRQKVVWAVFLLLMVELKVSSAFFLGSMGTLPQMPALPGMPAMPTMAPFCNDSPWGNCKHGSCSWTYRGYLCDCHNGWKGQWCDQMIQSSSATAAVLASVPTRSTTKSALPSTTSAAAFTTTTASTIASTVLTTKTKPPTTTTTSIHVPTRKTTVQSASTLTTMSDAANCSVVSAISSLAHHTQESNQDADPCPSGDHTSGEAFVLNNCDVNVPSLWRSGVQVSAHCASIPKYTPIAVFNVQGQHPVGTPAGIFIGCDQNGFKVALQTCYKTGPAIMRVQFGELNNIDPDTYFTLN